MLSERYQGLCSIMGATWGLVSPSFKTKRAKMKTCMRHCSLSPCTRGILEGLGENRWFSFIPAARVVAVLINEVQRCLCLSCLIAKVKGLFYKRGN